MLYMPALLAGRARHEVAAVANLGTANGSVRPDGRVLPGTARPGMDRLRDGSGAEEASGAGGSRGKGTARVAWAGSWGDSPSMAWTSPPATATRPVPWSLLLVCPAESRHLSGPLDRMVMIPSRPHPAANRRAAPWRYGPAWLRGRRAAFESPRRGHARHRPVATAGTVRQGGWSRTEAMRGDQPDVSENPQTIGQ
jgi:hypothetical protein